MNNPLRPHITGRFFIACAFAAPLSLQLARAQAASDAVELDEVVISATRTPQEPRHVTGAVTVLPLDELAATQVADLRTALAQQAGVVIVNTGAVGAQSSVFLRGASSHQTVFFVDGVRMNDRSALYSNFLGGADLVGTGRVEVLRGPQSTLYGSSAMGGVILIETARGGGDLSGSMSATAGSFGTFGAAGEVSGGAGGLGYSAAVSHFQTENDRAANDYDQWTYATRIEYAVSDTLLFGATYRGLVGEYEEPGSVTAPWPGTVDFENHLVTAYGEIKPAENLISRLTAAWHRREYDFTSAFGSSPSRNTRGILDWQNTIELSEHAQIVAGANYEESRFTGSGVRYDDTIVAGYLSTLVRPVDAVTLTAGVRYDDYDSVGDATTWRAGAAWNVRPGTKLRVNYGTAFTAPSTEDRFGVPGWGQLANPNLDPEKSRGWDAGIDQTFADGRLTASATYFYNKFRNLFAWQTVDPLLFTGQIVNIDRATTQGVELAVSARPNDIVSTRLAYTYLDTEDDATGSRLIRRPRHTVDADVNVRVREPWLIGAGLHIVADRLDGFGATKIEDYTTVRFYTSYAVSAGLLLKLRVENVLDESYEETAGYPALPAAVYGSVEWRF